MNESKHSDLGGFIRQHRERANLSLRRLAERAGISNPYLSQIERGIRKPSAEILSRLSRALEISANTLYSQAGLIDVDGESPTVTDAIAADQRLGPSDKRLLLEMYQALTRSNGSVNNQDEQE